MTYYEHIIALFIEPPSYAVRDRDVVEDDAGFKGEGGYDGDVLIGDEGGERVFGLG